MTEYEFEDLAASPLCVDAVYRGGRRGNAGDDPLGQLLRVSNSGGFRYRGRIDKLEIVVLTTTLTEPDWPDSIDRETGIFTYYGDNRRPGRELHDTPRKGNALLARVFEDAHAGGEGRRRVPPIFIFANVGRWRDVKFLGLAVPGSTDLGASEDLVAIWRLAGGERFQNYRAKFTVLDAAVISRPWIESLFSSSPSNDLAPAAWQQWIAGGRTKSLMSVRSVEHRNRREQSPTDDEGREIIQAIHQHFSARPHDFEHCAAALAQMMLPDIAAIDVSRPSRDGGRDAVGKLRIGVGPGAILSDFALEAKCYGPSNSVGVRELSRLISRLRHRQFGILVTTSWVDAQAYKEVKEDQHPIIIVSASDIVELLKRHGHSTADGVTRWLTSEFSTSD